MKPAEVLMIFITNNNSRSTVLLQMNVHVVYIILKKYFESLNNYKIFHYCSNWLPDDAQTCNSCISDNAKTCDLILFPMEKSPKTTVWLVN